MYTYNTEKLKKIVENLNLPISKLGLIVLHRTITDEGLKESKELIEGFIFNYGHIADFEKVSITEDELKVVINKLSTNYQDVAEVAYKVITGSEVLPKDVLLPKIKQEIIYLKNHNVQVNGEVLRIDNCEGLTIRFVGGSLFIE
jgi:hypothetical protein